MTIAEGRGLVAGARGDRSFRSVPEGRQHRQHRSVEPVDAGADA